MQINKELIKIPDAIVKMAHQVDSRLTLEEISEIHTEYLLDSNTTICPHCEMALVESELKWAETRSESWDYQSEGETVCCYCSRPVSPDDLMRPEFDHWLKLTA